MKRVNLHAVINRKFPILMASLLAGVVYLSSCNKDESNGPAPTLTLSATTASNSPGTQVSTVVTVDAAEGGKILKTTVNGAADTSLPDVDLAGENSKAVTVNYTVPANAVVGSTIVIAFQAIDKKDQNSPSTTFSVTVSAVPSKQIVDVPQGSITADTHWTADKIYRLNGFVRVGQDDKGAGEVSPSVKATATLTIDAGTTIYGKEGTGSVPPGALIVQRGSKIIANGTVDKPIIFTSAKAPGTRKSGDWSGVILCGKGINNLKGSGAAGADGVGELEGGYGAFHGGGASADNADNSGSMKYVRIEYAGYPINPNQEINGLTFGSVGSGTVIDYIQVTYANDDSFEWFGGAVTAKHLIAYKGIDDDFDTDNGFSGRVQFGLGIRDATIADQSGSNGFEADNDGSGTQNQPFTSPQFSNMTLVGPKYQSNTTIAVQFFMGAHLRRNVRQTIINSVITAYPTGVFIDGTAGTPSAVDNANNGDLVLKNNILAGVENWGGNGFGSASTADERTADASLPFSVPQTAGSSTLGDYNHPAPPRGRVVAAGLISSGSNPYSNGVFGLGTDQQINSMSGMLWFSGNNTVLPKWQDAGINASMFEPLNGTPTLVPASGSALLSGYNFAGYPSFESVAYRGAFGTTDWTQGWVNWTPQSVDYSK